MEDFKTQYEVSQQENKRLNETIEQYHANKLALESTAQELLAANINFKAGAMLLEKKVTDLQTEIATLKNAAAITESVVDLTEVA